MNRKTKRPAQSRSGVILLVVLSALTFFSILVAAYLVFSNQSRDASFAISQRNTRAPDVNWVMNEALMTLIRGTSDPNNPFFGEDLLSDYYGRKDGLTLQVHHLNAFPLGPQGFGIGNDSFTGFVRFPISADGSARPQLPTKPAREIPQRDDFYAGKLITFTEGPLANRTYQILRSIFRPASGGIPAYDDLVIELTGQEVGDNATANAVRSLFYADNADLTNGGFKAVLNGSPRNSFGVGDDGNGIDEKIMPNLGQPIELANGNFASDRGLDLPVALQPNHLGRNVDKSLTSGDFDEDYDAPDFNNWFLSHRRADGTVIPSFHRPAVLNYLVNQENDWSSAGATEFQDLMVSLQRATFRPLPVAANQMAPGSVAINNRFTGGSSEYALRTALPINTNAPRLNQFLQALISGELDVDNDADGTADSIWMDLGLPTFTSREGKLIRPLVAPMIEDLGGRLNLNAHGNPQLKTLVATPGLLNNNQALWAGVTAGQPNPTTQLFRGLGWGPAEIMLPQTDGANAADGTTLTALMNDRYRYGTEKTSPRYAAGVTGRDPLDTLRTGYRPAIHRANGGFGYSTDPYGQFGAGVGRSGHILTAPVNRTAAASISEAIDNPYELDPSGDLGGDSLFTITDFEAILRSKEFDSELLPPELRNRIEDLIENHSGYQDSLTTRSVSSDHPTFSIPDLIEKLHSDYTEVQLKQLVAPELRLGRKLDVNRAFGNLVDDNDNGVIDEPLEVTRADSDGNDNDSDGTPDELGEVFGENDAFRMVNATPPQGTIPTDFANVGPNYTWTSPKPTDNDQIPINGRQLLARHLYILVMALSRDLDNPTQEAFFPESNDNRSFADAGSTKEFYKARRLAQWAVNVVDYRDPDAIMTRFVFDPTPFDNNGWSPPSDEFSSSAPPQNVVWGVEAPQLLFSESMAFHDVRLRDDDRDDGDGEFKDLGNGNGNGNGNGDPDDDSDQVRMPQGSLFLELYCPHPTLNGDDSTKPGFPGELYDEVAVGDFQLNLAAQAPLPNGNAGGAPVWRIAITERHDQASGQEDLSPARLRSASDPNGLPDSASFEPTQPNELVDNGANASLGYGRFIFFTGVNANIVINPDQAYTQIENLISVNNINDMSPERVFIAPQLPNLTDPNADPPLPPVNVDRFLEPGQFLVLAPRIETNFGSKVSWNNGRGKALGVGNGNANGVGNNSQPDGPSDQRWNILANQGLVQSDHDNVRLTPTLSSTGVGTPALPMVIAAPRPPAWTPPSAPLTANLENGVVGLSVSEPLPRSGSYYPQPNFQYFGTDDWNGPGSGNPYQKLTDAYIDYSDSNGPKTAKDAPLDVTTGLIPTLGGEPFLGTVPDYRSAFLQRLADPKLPYNEVTNPYRTVDWIPIDLTIFSGEDRESKISAEGEYTRRSRQRNGHTKQIGNNNPVDANALFSYETDFQMPDTSIVGGNIDGDYFRFDAAGGTEHLQSSFSFLNTDSTQIGGASASWNPGFVGFRPTIGMLGSPGADGVSGNDRNLPQTAYAVHPWLNRPFASHLELMMVPACSQGRLFEEFSINESDDPEVFSNGANDATPELVYAPFRHLLNFFHSSDTPGSSLELARLFDLVNTLPRFRGEVEFINPARLNDLPQEVTNVLSPPFNFQYDNHRQGTINLNTLNKFPVWAGLMQGHLNPNEFTSANLNSGQLSFDAFRQSRRGYPIPNNPQPSKVTGAGPYNYDPDHLSANYPTEFAGVVRSAISAPKAIEVTDATGDNGSNDLRRGGVDGGLLRDTAALSAAAPSQTSLFVRGNDQLPSVTTSPAHNRLNNAFMRYQTLMRMPNLVSDNSQVFLIRMTVGFFEVDAATQSLGREYNAEAGKSQRYQATFVIDRSIPVGFEPGNDLNARDVVIFESYAQ